MCRTMSHIPRKYMSHSKLVCRQKTCSVTYIVVEGKCLPVDSETLETPERVPRRAVLTVSWSRTSPGPELVGDPELPQ